MKIKAANGVVLLLALILYATPGCTQVATLDGGRVPAATVGVPLIIPTFHTQTLAFAPACHRQAPAFAFQLTPTFSERQAYLMLLAAFLSHQDAPTVRRQLRQWGFARWWLLGEGDHGAYGYLAEHEHFVLIAFRGTETVLGGFSNADVFPRPAADLGITGNVHGGYQNLTRRFHAPVQDLLTQTPAKPIFLTGHSLGGALALIEALVLEGRGYPVAAVYTFGQPRVGDETFRQAADRRLGGRYYRLAAPEDITPHVPPTQATVDLFSRLLPDRIPFARSLLAGPLERLGYAPHPGQGYRLTEAGEVVWQGPESEDQEAAYWRDALGQLGAIDLLFAGDWLAAFTGRFSNHKPEVYLCRLARAVTAATPG